MAHQDGSWSNGTFMAPRSERPIVIYVMQTLVVLCLVSNLRITRLHWVVRALRKFIRALRDCIPALTKCIRAHTTLFRLMTKFIYDSRN